MNLFLLGVLSHIIRVRSHNFEQHIFLLISAFCQHHFQPFQIGMFFLISFFFLLANIETWAKQLDCVTPFPYILIFLSSPLTINSRRGGKFCPTANQSKSIVQFLSSLEKRSLRRVEYKFSLV